MAVYSYIRKPLLESTKYKKPSEPYKVTKYITVRDVNGTPNLCCYLKGSDTLFRCRAEMLILKDDYIFLDTKSRKNEYRVPGGAWEEDDRSHADSAIREAQEEAHINVKDVEYGTVYTESVEPHDWVKEKISEAYWWYGYYTEVYVGVYDSEYKGKIAKMDQDDFYKYGDWYKIDDVYSMLKEPHKEAISSYTTEAFLIEASDLSKEEKHQYIQSVNALVHIRNDGKKAGIVKDKDLLTKWDLQELQTSQSRFKAVKDKFDATMKSVKDQDDKDYIIAAAILDAGNINYKGIQQTYVNLDKDAPEGKVHRALPIMTNVVKIIKPYIAGNIKKYAKETLIYQKEVLYKKHLSFANHRFGTRDGFGNKNNEFVKDYENAVNML